MCIFCVAIPFVLITLAPRYITASEVNLFFLLETVLGPFWVWLVIKEQPSLETIIGPIWVWMFIKEQPSLETIQGGSIIILTIAIHSFLKIKNS